VKVCVLTLHTSAIRVLCCWYI